jgi:hypothetical protein
VIKPVNPERRAKARERNYTGDRPDLEPKDQWVRSFPCIGCGSWPTEAAHAIARGMGACGGDSTTLVPLCHWCHLASSERGTRGRRKFEVDRKLVQPGEDPGDALVRIAAELEQRWRSGEDSYGAPY